MNTILKLAMMVLIAFLVAESLIIVLDDEKDDINPVPAPKSSEWKQ